MNITARAEQPEDSVPPEEVPALTAEEAQQLRARWRPLSPWRVVALQGATGLVVALAAWGLSGRQSIGWSSGYGALCVVLPAAVFARGLSRSMRGASRGAAPGWVAWEIAKIALSVAMLLLAPRLVPGLSWPALLLGMVVTMKMVWVALWLQSRAVKTNGLHTK